MNPRQSYPGTGAEDPAAPPFLLRALRKVPAFRGKDRIARNLLSRAQKNQCVAIQDLYGNEMVLPNLTEPVGFSLCVNGSYEPEAVDLLRRCLSDDTDFVDIGANIGSYTVALAGQARRVLAIEASPAVIPYLRRNVELTGRRNIDVLGVAAAAPGVSTVPFYIPPMSHFGMGSSAAQFSVEPVEVKACSLDQILRERGGGWGR